MNVAEFAEQYPQYVFDFAEPISAQLRVYDSAVLGMLPRELTPCYQYRGGGRGRPNLNQTRAHSQCGTCKRVRRNDFFYTPPSMVRKNVVFTHCLECTQALNAKRYDVRSKTMRSRQAAIWRYLAPRCAICGFDRHSSAMDLHHLENQDDDIGPLIIEVALTPNAYTAEKLLRLAAECVALCSNCHRMYHSGAIELDGKVAPLRYQLTELMTLLKATK